MFLEVLLPWRSTYPEQIFGNNAKSGVVVRLVLQPGIAVENSAEDVEEELKGVLIQEVDLVQAVHREVNIAASLDKKTGGLGDGER